LPVSRSRRRDLGFLSEIELLLAPVSLNPYHRDLTHGILRSGAW